MPSILMMNLSGIAAAVVFVVLLLLRTILVAAKYTLEKGYYINI